MRLDEIPQELLHHVVECLYEISGRTNRSLSQLSLTCKLIRETTLAFLFEVKTLDLVADSSNTLRLLKEDDAEFIFDSSINVLSRLKCLNLIFWQRFPSIYQHVSYPDALDTWRTLASGFSTLTTLSLDPPESSTLTTHLVGAYRDRPLHMVVDLRKGHPALSYITWRSWFRHQSWKWSVAMHDGTHSAGLAVELPFNKLRALQWTNPAFQRRPYHEAVLHKAIGGVSLEELSIDERALTSSATDFSYAPQICDLILSLQFLKRLHVAGTEVSRKLLEILPQIQSLEALSISSSYRNLFHPSCEIYDYQGLAYDQGGHFQMIQVQAADIQDIDTKELPWVRLPRLKFLEFGFVCRHFSMAQMIPRNLEALRIEFYGRSDRISVGEIHGLAEHCPELERLEVDVSHFSATTLDVEAEDHHGTRAFLSAFSCFRRLRVLRLFPSYWPVGHLLTSPLPHGLHPVRIFQWLRRQCPSLQKLIICISTGEYPLNIVHDMDVANRPRKFVMEAIDEDRILYREAIAATSQIFEQIYLDQIPLPKPITIFKSVPTAGREFFDDLKEGWTFQRYDVEEYDLEDHKVLFEDGDS